MIPKIIHYSWFSNEPIPNDLNVLISKWKEIMPDYKFILWDGKMLEELNNNFANEAVSVKKWAFASDFLRLYAVYNYGGIWFDTDIEVFKSFDIFLSDRMFIANEAGAKGYSVKFHWLTAHCFGAEKFHPYIKDCLDFYIERNFIRTENDKYPEDLKYDLTICPEVMATVAKKYGYNDYGFNDNEQFLEEGIHVYPSYYFDKPLYTSMEKVYSIHREAGSWRINKNGNHLNYHGTDKRKGKVFNKLKILLQRIMMRLGFNIIRVR